MKKKIFVSLIVIAIAAIATFNVNMNTQSSDLSDLSLANVEALAETESSSVTCHQYAQQGRWNICWYRNGTGCLRNGDPKSACQL